MQIRSITSESDAEQGDGPGGSGSGSYSAKRKAALMPLNTDSSKPRGLFVRGDDELDGDDDDEEEGGRR